MKTRLNRVMLLASMMSVFYLGVERPMPAVASEVDILMNKLVEKGILTRIDVNNIRAEIKREKFARVEKEPVPVEAPALPSWLEGMTAKGDLRLRYEGMGFEDEDGRDRARYRFRLRWGLEKKFDDEFKAGFRLASGADNDPTSTNTTFDTEFIEKEIDIDRAYAIFTPTAYFQGFFPSLVRSEMGGGKFANPYQRWDTALVWDSDVNPEGVYERLDFKLADIGEEGSWELSTMLGQFVLEESASGNDLELFAYGIGTDYRWTESRNLEFGFVYYDWQDYAQFLKSGSAVLSSPRGNDTEVEDFKILSFYLEGNTPISTFWGDRNLKLFGHCLHNTDEGDLTPNAGNDDAYSGGIRLGQAKKKGEWETSYQYFYIEPNSTVGNFSEASIGSGGGTNWKTHKVQYKYQLTNYLQLALTSWFSESVTRSGSEDAEVSRWQADLIYKF